VTGHHAQPALEMQLELVLAELLGEGAGVPRGAPRVSAVPAEVTDLADMARRLRAASQWIPLPEGRGTLRQALLAAAAVRLDARPIGQSLARRPGRRFAAAAVAAAAALIVGLFNVGASLAWNAGSPSSRWYGVRVALVELQVALASSQLGKAEMLVSASRTRITEIEGTASGDARTLRRAADVLDGETAWLHAVMLGLPAADRERVVSDLTAVMGTFSDAALRGLSGGSTSALSLPAGATSADRAARVSAVARAAALLKAQGKLPPSLTVGDLVSRAAEEHVAGPPASPHLAQGAGRIPGTGEHAGKDEPAQITARPAPAAPKLKPYSAEANYMSLAGYVRYVIYRQTGQWLGLPEATRIVRHAHGL